MLPFYNSLSNFCLRGSQGQKNILFMPTIYGKRAQMVTLEMGGVCAWPVACLFVWPEPGSVLMACRGSQSPAVCCLLGSTEEMPVCLSLKGRSVMTWSNNYYTLWQQCVCVYTWAFALILCNLSFLPGWRVTCEIIRVVLFVRRVHVLVQEFTCWVRRYSSCIRLVALKRNVKCLIMFNLILFRVEDKCKLLNLAVN